MMDMLPDTAIARPRVETCHEHEASYQLLFLHHPTPMWFMEEMTLAFLEVNEAAIRHYGYTRDEFSRMTMLNIRLPEEVPPVLDHGQREYAAPGHERVRPPNMWRHRTQDGTVIDVDIVRSLVVFRGRQASLVIAYDVTERTRGEMALRKSYEELDRRVKERTFALAQANVSLRAEVAERVRAEVALRDREERLHLAQQAGQMGTWEWDVQTGALQWSTALEPMHGVAPGSFPGMYEAFLDIIHAEDRAWFRQAVAHALESGTAFEGAALHLRPAHHVSAR